MSPPTEQEIAMQTLRAQAEERLASPVLISAVRPAEHGGPGAYYFCLKQATAPTDNRWVYFSVFSNGEEYRGVRSSVIMDDCEKQTYAPPLTIAPVTPVPKTKRNSSSSLAR